MIATGTAWKNSTRIGHGEGGKGENQKKFSYKLDIVSKYFVLPKKTAHSDARIEEAISATSIGGKEGPPIGIAPHPSGRRVVNLSILGACVQHNSIDRRSERGNKCSNAFGIFGSWLSGGEEAGERRLDALTKEEEGRRGRRGPSSSLRTFGHLEE